MTAKSALLIIDVQNDFCEGGSLAVPGGRSLIEPINELIASKKWDLIIASKDWHPEGHVSFASAHPHKQAFEPYELRHDSGKIFATTLWPDHCVDGTPGAEIVEGLNISEADHIVYKGHQPDVEFYSAFRDVFGHNSTELPRLLQQAQITEVVIVGLALDFCVMNTAIDAARDGYKTTVDLRCTKAISDEGADTARARLQQAGVQLLNA